MSAEKEEKRVEEPPRSFSFGDFVLIPARQLLLENETPVRIGSRALDILTALAERPGEIVTKRELLARAWPDTTVDESNLKVNMAALRRVLREGQQTQYIATVIGRGYRFVAPVRTAGWAGAPLAPGKDSLSLHNLPSGTTRVVGRANTIATLCEDLIEARLVSIVGAGGVGKTTVALSLAEQSIGSVKDGIWFVDLAPLKDPGLIANAIATATGLTAQSANMLAALCDYLRTREMLILLDSCECEHVIDAVAACADRILAEAPGVKILATSREPLRLKGERVRRLSGLGTPPISSELTASEALAFPAVELFADRATDRLESFTLRDSDAPVVAEICRRLDGLPLAIELAATQIDVFGVDGLYKQLDDRFRLLTGWRAGPERHRTLAATLDWSYELLSEAEAALLRAVSLFASGFQVEDALAVSNASLADVLESLSQLAAKSLLAVDVSADVVSYRLLDTTRAYAIDRLQLAGEDQAVRRRHAEHVCAVLERAATEWTERSAREWGNAYRRFLDDLRDAAIWARSNPANRLLHIRLTVAGLLLWNHFSLTEECRIQVSHAVGEIDAAGLAGTAAEMQLQVWFGGVTMFTHGLSSQALDAMRRALDIAVQIGDIDTRVRCLRLIGVYQLFTGENDAAIHTLETFRSIAAAEFPSALLEAEAALGIGELFVGRLQHVRRRFEQRHALDLQGIQDARRVRHHVRYLSDRIVDVTNTLSHAQWLTGSPDMALRTAEASVEYALKTEHHLSLGNALSWVCPVFYWTGQYEACSRYITMLDEQARRHSFAIRRPVAMFYRAALACAERDHPGDEVENLACAIEEFYATGHLARLPYYLGVLAEYRAKDDRLDDAESTIRTALDRARLKNDQWCLPEILRVRALILSAKGEGDDAEAILIQSMTLAGEIGASSWRLRAAVDLAGMWAARSKAEDAFRILLPMLGEFTEGFQTRDVMAAVDLLASLERSAENVTAEKQTAC